MHEAPPPTRDWHHRATTWRRAGRICGATIAAFALGSCTWANDTSGNVGAVERAGASTESSPPPDVETFGGTLDGSQPAARPVHLEAGDALAVRARPPSGFNQDDHGLSLAIALQVEQLPNWDSFEAHWGQTEFYSDYTTGDGPDPYDSSQSLFPEHGVIIARTAWYDPESVVGNYGCDRFMFVSGRETGEGPRAGTWLMFVAPFEADYNVILAGEGPFEILVAVHPLGELEPPATTLPPFDADAATGATFSTAEWQQAVEAHLDFFFDPALIGDSDDFSYADDGDGFGPSETVREAIESECGL